MSIQTLSYCVKSYARTDVGLIRDNNEDVWAALPEHNIYLLADGMGGHAAGEIAAQQAIEILSLLIPKTFGAAKKRSSTKEAIRCLDQSIRKTNTAVHKQAQADRDCRGMGTTLCCTYFHEDGLIYAHVGDSRIYHLHKNTLTQLTQDHSLVSELIELGEMNTRQLRDCDFNNIITRAVGIEACVEPAVGTCELAIGDLVLMCSDGLSDLLSHSEIEEILNKRLNIEDTVSALIDEAKNRGGHDNITVVLLQVFADDEKNLS